MRLSNVVVVEFYLEIILDVLFGNYHGRNEDILKEGSKHPPQELVLKIRLLLPIFLPIPP